MGLFENGVYHGYNLKMINFDGDNIYIYNHNSLELKFEDT